MILIDFLMNNLSKLKELKIEGAPKKRKTLHEMNFSKSSYLSKTVVKFSLFQNPLFPQKSVSYCKKKIGICISIMRNRTKKQRL